MSEEFSRSNYLWDIRQKIIEGAQLTDDEKEFLSIYLFMAATLEHRGHINVPETYYEKKGESDKTTGEVLKFLWWQQAAIKTDAVSEFKNVVDAKKKGRGHADELLSARIELVEKIFNESQTKARKIVAEKTGSTIESVEFMHKRYKKKLKKSD